MSESEILYSLGVDFLRLGDYRRAEETFSKARELSEMEKRRKREA